MSVGPCSVLHKTPLGTLAGRGKDDRGFGGDGNVVSREGWNPMDPDISMPATTPVAWTPRELTPLSSGYQAVQHGAYARHLTAALQQPKVLNIALTGGYGSGKSSVIEHIENSETFKVLNVAISSLGNDLGEPGSAAEGVGEGADLTNRIEKAVVKQLLYRKSPEKVPASDFHRLSSFPLGRATATSAAAVTGAGAVPVLLGWNPDLLGQGAVEWVTGLAAVGIAAAGLTALRAFLHQRFSIGQLSAAGASVTLARRPTSYFDKYLAEIVYFFEVTEYNVVVFEDLDRFENPGIFEALRELNTILNESEQVGRKVRFVYAVRDSVFEKLGKEHAPADSDEEDEPSGSNGVAAVTNSEGDADAAQAEVERANRTKFFDIVIPLVPFITHRSAHELLAQLFPNEEAHRPSDALIDLVARHVPDMRMLKNIRNEYCVFAEELLVNGKGAPDLSPDTLLSLVLYKHFHLADFEKIIHGRSDLDTLYEAYRTTVNDSIRDADRRLRALDLSDTIESAIRTRADELGARFNQLVDVARHGQKLLSIKAGTTEFGTSVTDWPEFWRQAAADDSITITYNRQGYHNSPASQDFTTDTLEWLLDHPLTEDGFRTQAARSVEVERQQHRANREFLRGTSIAALDGRPEFAANNTGLPLARVVDRLRSKLARELVREGYIDHNFTLYVAQFYGARLSKHVQTFIVRNVDTNTPDANYQLSPGDVVTLLAEAGPRCLRGASAYNVSVLDYLLAQRDPDADPVLDRLAAFGKQEQSFVETYLSNGAHPDRLSAGLARRWPHTLVYLAHDAELDAGRRVTYVDAALSALTSDIFYHTDDALGEFLSTNYAAMSSYTGKLQPSQVDRIVAVTQNSAAKISDLSALHPAMRRAIVEADLYPLTAINLRAAMDEAPSIALNHVRHDKYLYKDCLEQPDAFMAAIAEDDGTTFTVDEPQHFPGILKHVAKFWGAQHVEAFIVGSAPACVVPLLEDAPNETWVPLARYHRFPATIANVEDYRAEYDIDQALGDFLTAAETIEVSDEVAQSDLRALAAALLNSPAAIADPADRVRLAQSLDLADPLEPSDVPAEAGPLLSMLLAAGLLADTAETFTRFASTDWTTIESAIPISAAFGDHLSPATLPIPLVKDFLCSTDVPEELKVVVLSRAAEFIEPGDTHSWQAAAEFQLGSDRKVNTSTLQIFTAVGLSADTVVQLADRYLDEGGDAQRVLSALAGIGGPYSTLTGGPGETAELPYELNKPIFERLRTSGVVAKAYRGTRPKRDKLIVVLR